ncbi:MAG: TraR/DksA C4-type zinc finger protein [Anaerolineae bacterium]|nr:TraR/DksA C4-type zinc finger protein [Anaerolineae bacterium]
MVIRSREELRRMLEEERASLLKRLGREIIVEHENLGYGNHMADDATEAYEQVKDLAVRQTLERTLRDVEYALQRFKDGTYGVCEVCHKEIDWARLEAKPYATLCIRCQQIREQGLT